MPDADEDARVFDATFEWTPAQAVPALPVESYQQIVDVSSDGHVVVVASEIDEGSDTLRAARYVPGAGWAAPEVVATGIDLFGLPTVVVDADGRVVVVWTEDTGRASVFARVYEPGSGWGDIETLETEDGSDAFLSGVAFGADGEAVAVWYFRDRVPSVWFNRHVSGEGWGTAAPTGLQSIFGPQLATNDDGDIWLQVSIWDGSEDSPSSWQIWVQRYQGLPGWSDPVRVSDAPDTSAAFGATMAVGPDGSALVVWNESVIVTELLVRFDLWGARFAPDCGWGTPERIHMPAPEFDSSQEEELAVAIGPGGHAAVGWRERIEDSDCRCYRRSVRVRRFAPDAGWSDADIISLTNLLSSFDPEPIMDVSLAVDARGNVVATWLQYGQLLPEYINARVWTNRYLAEEGWGEPIVISEPGDLIHDIQFNASMFAPSTADVLAVWNELVSGSWTVRFSRFSSGTE